MCIMNADTKLYSVKKMFVTDSDMIVDKSFDFHRASYYGLIR